MYNLTNFNIYTCSFNHHCNKNNDHIHHLQRFPHEYFHSSSHQIPLQAGTDLSFPPEWFVFSGMLCKWNHAELVFSSSFHLTTINWKSFHVITAWSVAYPLLSIYLLMDIWVVCSWGLRSVIVTVWTFVYRCFLSFLSGKYFGMEWLSHTASIQPLRNCPSVHEGVVLSYPPTNSEWWVLDPHILSGHCIVSSFHFSHF